MDEAETCNSQDTRKPDSSRACRTQKRKRPEPVSKEQLECQQLGYVITVDAWRVSMDIRTVKRQDLLNRCHAFHNELQVVLAIEVANALGKLVVGVLVIEE